MIDGAVSVEVTRRVEAASEVPATLLGALRAAASEFTPRGGWLLVDGADCAAQNLVETFHAYRAALCPPAAPVDALSVSC